SGPRASPTVAEGKVITLGVRGMLSCLEAANGKLLWRKDEFNGAYPRFFTASSPLVADGLCIAQLGGGEKEGGVFAYELSGGMEKPRGPIRPAVHRMPPRAVAAIAKDGAWAAEASVRSPTPARSCWRLLLLLS